MSARWPTPRQAAWRRSPRLPQIGREALKRWHAQKRPLLPICGAKAKLTGQPCRQPALENGRCRFHGGRTPKGDDWHAHRWPKGGARPERKLNRKLADLERRRKAQQARVAAMTPDERARYADWKRRHKPGSAAARKAACAEIKSSRETRAFLAKAALAERKRVPTPLEIVAARIDEKIARLARLQNVETAPSSDDLGIFE